MNTLHSLDKAKVHILCTPDLSEDSNIELMQYMQQIYGTYGIKILILPFEIHSVLSKEMTDEEFDEIKEAIKNKKSINDMLHTPLN